MAAAIKEANSDPTPTIRLQGSFTGVVRTASRVLSTRFGPSGGFLAVACQDSTVSLYNTADPLKWAPIKTWQYSNGHGTLTDLDISPDSSRVACSTLTSSIWVAHTNPLMTAAPLQLELGAGQASDMGVGAVKFTPAGHTLAAGCTDHSVRLVELSTKNVIWSARDHKSDVNAVACDVETGLIFSGSDDCTIRGYDPRVAGGAQMCFLGHTKGVTSLDIAPGSLPSRLLSNSQDQTMKLWDPRRPSAEQDMVAFDSTGRRSMAVDVSTKTFTGHSVHQTLIRGHWGPLGGTHRYVHSGSACGRVFIWDADYGMLAGVVNVDQQTNQVRSRDKREKEWLGDSRDKHDKTVIRDTTWHPSANILVAGGFAGPSLQKGTVSAHHIWDKTDELDGWVDLDGDALRGKSESWIAETNGPSGYRIIAHLPDGSIYCRARAW